MHGAFVTNLWAHISVTKSRDFDCRWSLSAAVTHRGGDAAAPAEAHHYHHRCAPAPLVFSRVAGPTVVVVAVHQPSHTPSSAYTLRERERMDSGGESKREGEGAAKEPSSSLPHPLAPDPPTVIALATVATIVMAEDYI